MTRWVGLLDCDSSSVSRRSHHLLDHVSRRKDEHTLQCLAECAGLVSSLCRSIRSGLSSEAGAAGEDDTTKLRLRCAALNHICSCPGGSSALDKACDGDTADLVAALRAQGMKASWVESSGEPTGDETKEQN